MTAPRVYADFQNLDDCNRLRLTCAGTKQDLARQGITLHEGQTLTFFMDDADDQGQPDDLLVEGIVHFDEGAQSWVASVDWSAIRHDSDAGKQTANGAALFGSPQTSETPLS